MEISHLTDLVEDDGDAGSPPLLWEENADDILQSWLADLRSQIRDGDEDDEDVVEGYRQLGIAILREGLEGPEVDVDESEQTVERALTQVARGSRRARRSISSTLRPLDQLPSKVVEILARREELSRREISILRAAVRVDEVLDRTMRRLVEILETTARRSHQEQSDALIAVTDVLAHELDNRLGAARTAGDMLTSPELKLDAATVKRIGELVQKSVDAAMQTVDDVRSLVGSSGNDGSSPVEGSMTVDSIVRNTVSDLTEMADRHDVRVECELSDLQVRVDPGRMRLVLYNLLSNALKYHDPGKDDRWVRITGTSADGRFELRLEDNGVGIGTEVADSIFLYGTRGDRSEAVGGSGLGLAIVQEAVDQMGGDISLSSDLGKGTTVTITGPAYSPG